MTRFRPLVFSPAWSAIAVSACGGGDPAAGWSPDQWCPGDPSGGCDPAPGAPLEAGAGVVSIVPACFESWTDTDGDSAWSEDEPFADCGCDRLCPGDPGYAAADEGEGDGSFRAAWLGGFQNGRAATGVRGATLGLRGEGDGLWARVIVLTQGETTVALVGVDALGIMIDQTTDIRDAVAAAGHDVDLVVVQSSHVHEAPDTMGIYGPGITETGFDAAYAAQIAEAVAEAVGQALASQEEVSLTLGTVDATDRWENGIANLVSDTRDPVVVDPRVHAAHFAATSDGHTVATLVHWANHPETVADGNTLLTSDFAHALRETVEEGVQWGADPARPGLGGTAIFFNGAVGGMMTSLRADVTDPTGQVWSEASFEKADVVGQLVGEMALDAVEAGVPIDLPDLWFRRSEFSMPVENTAFQAMFILGVLDHREVYDYDPEEPIDDDNEPSIRTEVVLAGVGPWRLVTIPGELLPEIAVGGYDGSFTPPGTDLVSADNPNPPDLAAAPAGPYLLERVGGEPTWVLGLGNDEIGYIIPPYNFEVADAAYLMEAEGHHYEETNSLGPQTAPLVEGVVDQLVSWSE